MLKPILKKALLNLSPGSYKKRVFRKLSAFSWATLNEIHLDPELLLLTFLLTKKENVFIDLGANKGEYTFVAEQLISPANIHAFEPNPQLSAILKKVFPDVHVYPEAISDRSGSAVFKVPLLNNKSDDTLGTLETSLTEKDETGRESFTVNTITLDEFVRQNKLNSVSLIKIDVEGHEMAVIKGAGETISRFRPDMIVEIEERHHRDQSMATLLKPYFDMGYHSCYFSFAKRKLIVLHDPSEAVQNMADHGTRHYLNNFIFIHNKERFSAFINAVNLKAAGL